AFQCTSIGYFPDPDNCRLFYYCSLNTAGDAIEAEALTCRDGYVFDITAPQTGYCKLQAFSRCNTINCTGLTVPTYFCTAPGVGLAIACPDNQPNCVSNASGGLCSAMKDEQCPVPASDYVCTSVGRFPDPKNCRLFYNCEWNDDYSEIVAVPMRCRSNYVFDELAINGDCRLQRGSNDCTRVNCINSAPASYVPYGRSRQLYALCLSNNTIMFSCPDNNQVDLKVSPPKCSYRCIFLGKFPYSRDVFKYYDCFISAVTYRVESELKTCPRRQEFNPQSRLCEKSNRPSTTLPVTTLPSTTLTESGTSTASNTTLIIPL
ncbi:unnamed protein product, partial [Diamesa hyperborea]